MVYHAPGTEPWTNSKWLGPLRILISDEQSAELPRRLVLFLARYTIYAYGVAKVIENILEKAQGKHSVIKMLKDMKDQPGFAGKVVKTYLSALGVYFVYYLLDKWVKHMYYIKPDSHQFFWVSDAEGNAPAGAKGVLFNKKKDRWFAWPILSQDQGMIRGFNFCGMTLPSFLYTEMTVGFEYPTTAFCRIFMRYFCVPKWNNPKADRKKLYLGMLNTTFITFINLDAPKGDELYRNIVMDNILLPYNQTAMRLFDRIIFHLDHDNWVLTKVTMYYTDNDRVSHKEVYGSLDNTENTYPDLTEQQNLDQAAMVSIVTVSLFSHALVHWWANGTACLPEGVWNHARTSTDITQWMNSQAVFLSWLFFGNSLATIETVLVRNNSNGLPHHWPPAENVEGRAFMIEMGKRSKFHQMSSTARSQLTAYLGQTKQSPNIPEVDAIVAATVMHSAEHYYANFYFPLFGTNGSVMALKSDMSGLVQALIAPIAYHTRAWLVRQHLSDPICKIVYDCSYNVDSDFANSALSLGCAF